MSDNLTPVEEWASLSREEKIARINALLEEQQKENDKNIPREFVYTDDDSEVKLRRVEITTSSMVRNYGLAARMDDEAVQNNFICMHCASPFIQVRQSTGRLLITHPVPDDWPHKPGNECEVMPWWTAQEAMIEIGKMVRYVHTKPVIMSESVEPDYTDHHPDEHLTHVLQPLLTPHLEALASVIHLTEALGPMQQWSFMIADDCGFEGEIVVRVKTMGECTLGRGSGSPSSPESADSSTPKGDGVIPFGDADVVPTAGTSEQTSE